MTHGVKEHGEPDCVEDSLVKVGIRWRGIICLLYELFSVRGRGEVDVEGVLRHR